MAAYRIACSYPDQPSAARAAVALGQMLHQAGDTPGARTAYQIAIDSNDAVHAEHAKQALRHLDPEP